MEKVLKGVERNYKTASKFYWIAPKLGHVSAKINLGVMYVKAIGLPQDYVIWYMLFDIANSEGHKLAVIARDQTAIKMLPSQIEKAKEKTKNRKVV